MDPSTAEIASITDLSALLDWVGVEDAAPRLGRTSLLKALGGPKMIRQLVAIPAKLYEDTMAALKIGVTGGAAEDPTPLEVGQLGEIRRVARIVLGLAPEAALAPPPTGTGSGGGSGSHVTFDEMTRALKEAIRPSAKKILASQVVDQCDGTEVVPLDAALLQSLSDDWKVILNDGEEPTEEEEATAEQLAALNARVVSGATPYVDFGVWRPYGARMGRAMKFVAHIQQADGTTLAKEISGPNSILWWKKCWKVYAYAMAVLKHASVTRLQRYADRVVSIAEEFPAYWWVVAQADIKMRSEGLERIRRDCVKRAADGTLKDFDKARPWDVVYREAAASDFWLKEVDKVITHIVTRVRSVASVQDAGYGPIVEVRSGGHLKGSRAAASETDDEPGPSKKTKKKKNSGKRKRNAHGGDAAENNHESKGPKKGGPTPGVVNLDLADRKTGEGKFTRDAAGKQLCWTYNKDKNCPTPCPNGRSHRCEWCREDHPAVKCRRGGR